MLPSSWASYSLVGDGCLATSSIRQERRPAPSSHHTTEVREWAKAQGIDVKDRGRIPAELVVKFKAATGN